MYWRMKPETDVEKLRKKIDGIDGRIVGLIEKRLKIVREIGGLKTKQGYGLYDPMREQKVLENVCGKSGLDDRFVRGLFRSIIEYCRLEERGKHKGAGSVNAFSGGFEGEHVVAVLGPEGTFTETAARAAFKDAEFRYCDTAEDIFKLVESGSVSYGVVAIENSIEGSVSKTMNCLVEYDIKISREMTLDINLCLMAEPGVKKEDIVVVVSHPHALAQCNDYLKRNYPNVKLQSSNSTSAAMKEIATMKNAAAIGLKDAAVKYGLNIISENIQDDLSQTRFIVISKKPGAGSKTSIIFAVKDEPGSLYAVLKEFADVGINLTKIESRPSKRRLGEYVFFMDFEGKNKVKQVEDILETIKPKTTFLKTLGSY